MRKNEANDKHLKERIENDPQETKDSSFIADSEFLHGHDPEEIKIVVIEPFKHEAIVE